MAAAYAALAAKVAAQSHHRLSGEATLALIKQTGSPPANGTQTTAGPLRLSARDPRSAHVGLGRGAVLANVSFHGGAFQGSAILYQPKGTISFRTDGNVSVNGQTVTFHGQGPITGGTGLYSRAGGDIFFTGKGKATASADRYTLARHITLPRH